MVERLNMAEGTQGPGPEGPAIPPTDQELLSQPVGARVRHVMGLPETEQPAAIRRLGLEIGGGADTEPAAPEADWLPEGLRGSENETNPEKGRWLAEQIIEMRTKMSYEERYNAENGPKLRQLYKLLQEYVNAISRERNEKDPWDRYVRDAEGNVINLRKIQETPQLFKFDENKNAYLEQSTQADQQAEAEQPETLLTDEQRARLRANPLQPLLDEHDNPVTSAARRQEIQEVLSIYFGLAKEKGLLKGVDQVLTSIYREIEGLPASQARRLIAQRISEAQEAAELTFTVNSTDQEVVDLYRVWNPYIRWARQRFELMLQGENQPEHRGWEFEFPEKDESKETYWEVGNYPKYYNIIANTREQLLRAKESFLSMIRRGSIGKSPEAIYQHVDNFKEVFGQRGNRLVEAGIISSDFLTEQRQELEALLYVFGADYSNDTYNPKQYKEFMTAMALHEGPQRWVRLLRAGEGQVAAFTYMFDKETLMEIFNNPVGERGELDIIAQHFLQDQVMQMAIDRGIGIRLKDYDPEDQNPEQIRSLKTSNDPKDVEAREDSFDTNLGQLGLHMSDEKFMALYEGFTGENAHISNYLNFPEQDQSKLSPKLKESIELGAILLKLRLIRQDIRTGARKLTDPKKSAVDALSKEEKEIYDTAYKKAKANFEIAFQMQGASGEKVRRGKGFFYVDRNPHIQAYQEVEEKSARIEWLLKELKNGKKLEEFSEEIRDFYKGLTDQEKTKNPQDLYGIDSGKLKPEKQRSIQIGWMLFEMRNGRRLNSFRLEEQYCYYGLGELDQSGKFKFKDQATEDQVKAGTIQLETLAVPADREDYVDHIPVYLAEKFVQYAVTRTKVQHANSKAKDRTAAVAQAREDAIKQIKKFGWQAKLELPKILFNEKGDVSGCDETAKEPVDFQTAANHIYSRYTTHTYWGYQGENRQMILRPELFEAAKRIRAGLSRPEDEDVLASQLLIIDPTLKRVKKFGLDEIQREITLFQAAVEESALSHVYINKDLFKAFLPKDGHRGKMRSGYNMEDWGGMMRFTMGIKELSAAQPARFSRRLAAAISIMPMYLDSMAAIWGQDGVMGAVSMFADKIKDIGNQGIVSQFGITKFIDQQDYGVQLYNALIGSVQEGLHKEGLYMKPTNDNEVLHKFADDVISGAIETKPAKHLEFLQQLRSTFGRLETVLKIMRPMYSDVRNAGGALRLENVDIFLDNGKFNPDIETDIDIYMDTGTSRHLESDFYEEFAKWLISEWPGGGGQIYPEELIWNKYLKKTLYVFKGKGSGASKRPFKRWFFEKAGL